MALVQLNSIAIQVMRQWDSSIVVRDIMPGNQVLRHKTKKKLQLIIAFIGKQLKLKKMCTS